MDLFDKLQVVTVTLNAEYSIDLDLAIPMEWLSWDTAERDAYILDLLDSKDFTVDPSDLELDISNVYKCGEPVTIPSLLAKLKAAKKDAEEWEAAYNRFENSTRSNY